MSQRNAKFSKSKPTSSTVKESRKAAVAALTLEEKLAGKKRIKALEVERGKRRHALFKTEDEIDRRREVLIAEIEGKLQT